MVLRARPELVHAAQEVLRGFWAGNGGPEALSHAEADLGGLRLRLGELRDLRAGLPLGVAGTTGSNITRIDRVLKRLEHEKS